MSYLTQMAGLAVQNFVSAAAGIARRGRADPRLRPALGAEHRQLLGRPDPRHALRPAAALRRRRAGPASAQGVIAEPRRLRRGRPRSKARKQTIALGPVASQEAIKQLGTNGGGFFNANSRAPVREPDAAHELPRDVCRSSLIPAGADLHVRPDGRATSGRAGRSSAAMASLFLAGVDVGLLGRGSAATRCSPARRRPVASALQPGGNMEGKEVRFGIANSALFATVTTDASLRRGQRDARLLHAARRPGAAGQHAARRGDLRRRRRRALRHAASSSSSRCSSPA